MILGDDTRHVDHVDPEFGLEDCEKMGIPVVEED